jgi:hypothetical protein
MSGMRYKKCWLCGGIATVEIIDETPTLSVRVGIPDLYRCVQLCRACNIKTHYAISKDDIAKLSTTREGK